MPQRISNHELRVLIIQSHNKLIKRLIKLQELLEKIEKAIPTRKENCTCKKLV